MWLSGQVCVKGSRNHVGAVKHQQFSGIGLGSRASWFKPHLTPGVSLSASSPCGNGSNAEKCEFSPGMNKLKNKVCFYST